jgi:sulfur-carrier protein
MMPRVRYTSHLKRYFPNIQNGEGVEGTTVAEVVAGLDSRHPGLGSYIIDEHGKLRKHVNIFIGEHLIHDRERLSDPVSEDAQIYIMQALSGG